jgi:integrase
MPQSRLPSYRLHKATGQAVVVLDKRSIYLGVFGTPESRAKYDRVIARYLASRHNTETLGENTKKRPPIPPALQGELLISELVLRYWKFAKSYYVKNGRPTGEQHPLKQALRILRRHFGDTRAGEFGPLALKSLRDEMALLPDTRKIKVVDPDTNEVRFEEKVVRVGLARRTINKQIGRIKRAFAWAVAEELLPASVHEALGRLAGLRKGRTAARESTGVMPVLEEHIEAVIPHLSATVGDMVRIQWLSGCRPQEVVAMRGARIDRSGSEWEYRPAEYKSEHMNDDDSSDRRRVIFLGPRAQAILLPYFESARNGYFFSPMNAKRNISLPAKFASNKLAAHYTVASYRQAIQRACRRAMVPVWSPLQLRHTAGTSIRKKFGLERAQAVLGHRELGVTQIYAEVDRDAARAVMAELG